MKKDIFDFEYEELVNEFSKLGLEKYRVDQVLDWIFQKKVFDFNEMSNLSKENRTVLSERFSISLPF